MDGGKIPKYWEDPTDYPIEPLIATRVKHKAWYKYKYSTQGYIGNGYVNPKKEEAEESTLYGGKPKPGRRGRPKSVMGNPKEEEKEDAILFLEAPTMRLCKEATSKDDGLEAKLKNIHSKLVDHLRT